MRHVVVPLLVILAGCARPAVSPPAATTDSVPIIPRYRLEVGQELVYQLTKVEDLRSGMSKEIPADSWDPMEWRIVVGRKNDAGSLRLYFRTRIKYMNRDGTPRGQHDSLGYCDLHSDGTYTLDESSAIFKKLFPHHLFCKLPDASTCKTGWSNDEPVLGQTLNYKLGQQDDRRWQISGTQTSIYASINHWRTDYHFDFDVARGLVTKIATEWCDTESNRIKSRRTIELVSTIQRDPTWLAQYDREADAYLQQDAQWVELCYRGLRAKSVEVCRAMRSQGRAALVAGRAGAELNEVREMYDVTLECHDRDETWMAAAVAKRAAFFDAVPEFPTSWTANTLDGQAYSIADLRGRVIVLYFWETGCEYNVLMGSQIDRLRTKNSAKDVAIVGMFLRRGPADLELTRARAFISNCYHQFPHLDAGEIRTLYRLSHFGMEQTHAIVVLDPSGKVCEVLVGYASDHGSQIQRVIDELRQKQSQPGK